VQHGDTLGEVKNRIHVVVDDDHGSAAPDCLQELDGLGTLARTHAGEWLVE
jgi:hypothetical protein